ncbi:MAG TPA: archaeosortase/exosortase family protein, partial [Candidatus Aquabacterium excrementipullorum]|nr:archaeosortase/exosortase family protein [Candidatus Aquabacterium excrementipullorum]
MYLQLRKHSWLLLLAALVLYGPTAVELARGLWQDDRHSHGPVLVALACWLFWNRLKEAPAKPLEQPMPLCGWSCVLVGLLLYVIGRSQAFPLFEVLSAVPLTIGVALLTGGRLLVRHLAFCHFFLLFLVP